MWKINKQFGFISKSGFVAWCTIQCKPFLRKPHLKVEEGKASWDRALEYTVMKWNRLVDSKENK